MLADLYRIITFLKLSRAEFPTLAGSIQRCHKFSWLITVPNMEACSCSRALGSHRPLGCAWGHCVHLSTLCVLCVQRQQCVFLKQCVVEKSTRRFCPACRLDKCFLVGMMPQLILGKSLPSCLLPSFIPCGNSGHLSARIRLQPIEVSLSGTFLQTLPKSVSSISFFIVLQRVTCLSVVL